MICDAFSTGPSSRVNVYKMHLYCVGDGSPTVILEFGPQRQLALLVQGAAFRRESSRVSARTIAQPSAGAMRNLSRRIVGTLHCILHSLIEQCRSEAGRTFWSVTRSAEFTCASTRICNPSDVVGIDPRRFSSHPDWKKRFPSKLMKWIALQRLEFKLAKLGMPFGILRFFGLLCGDGPAEIRDMLRTVECRTRWAETQVAEYDYFYSGANEGRLTGSLGSMPLIVLSRDPDKNWPPRHRRS